ncbi:MAG: hypothetical protein V1869_03990 [Candidatus Omnitrophota bacterium]
MLVNIPILLLVSVVGAIALRHLYFLSERVPILENQEQNLLQELKKEKMVSWQLNAENVTLKAYLRSAQKRINKSFTVLGRLEKAVEAADRLKAQYSMLKAENSALLEDRNKLAGKNEAIKVKLDSAQEPKDAVKEVKKEAKPGVKAEDNRGVLFKAKQPASASRITIEVVPAASQK